MSVRSSVGQWDGPSVRPSVRSTHRSVRQSVCPSVCLSVRPSGLPSHLAFFAFLSIKKVENTDALWSNIEKKADVSTGPHARPFARLLVPLTRSLAPSLRLLPRSLESE